MTLDGTEPAAPLEAPGEPRGAFILAVGALAQIRACRRRIAHRAVFGWFE
jgi:hypothetical protein